MGKLLNKKKAARTISRTRITVAFILIVVLIIITFIASLMSGSIDISIKEIFDSLFGEMSQNAGVVYDVRLPRLLIALLAGAALAVSGTLLQAVMKNPLTSGTTPSARPSPRSSTRAWSSTASRRPPAPRDARGRGSWNRILYCPL